MAALDIVFSPILRNFKDDVIDKLIYDALTEGNCTSTFQDLIANTSWSIFPGIADLVSTTLLKIHADGMQYKIMSLDGVGIVMSDETLTSGFIKSCPLFHRRNLDGKHLSRLQTKGRRGGVSERNEFDRYIFRAIFENYVMIEHLGVLMTD